MGCALHSGTAQLLEEAFEQARMCHVSRSYSRNAQVDQEIITSLIEVATIDSPGICKHELAGIMNPAPYSQSKCNS
jgi:hypothetical protein